MENWQVKIYQNPMRTQRDIYIFRKVIGGKIEILQKDLETVKTINEHEARQEDLYTLSLPDYIFQALVDEIHDYKPTEPEYTEGKLEATEAHLSDLRQLLKLKD